MKLLKKEDVIAVLKKVKDPELDIDLWTLELIRDITIQEKNELHIRMTFTCFGCPLGDMIIEEMKVKLKEKGFQTIHVDVEYDPPWEPSETVKEIMGL